MLAERQDDPKLLNDKAQPARRAPKVPPPDEQPHECWAILNDDQLEGRNITGRWSTV